MKDFTITCKKCLQSDDETNISIFPAYSDDPAEIITENHFFIYCCKCNSKEKIYIETHTKNERI